MAGLRIRSVPRAHDEEVLNLIGLKVAGWSWSEIARHDGTRSYMSIQRACMAVCNADLAESREPAETVRAGYWH